MGLDSDKASHPEERERERDGGRESHSHCGICEMLSQHPKDCNISQSRRKIKALSRKERTG